MRLSPSRVVGSGAVLVPSAEEAGPVSPMSGPAWLPGFGLFVHPHGAP